MKSLIDVVRGMLTRKFVKDQDVSTHVQTEEQPAQNVASQDIAPQNIVKTQEKDIESIIRAMKQSMNEHGVPFVDRRWKLEQHTYHYEIRHGECDSEWVEELSFVKYLLTDTKTNVVFVDDTEDICSSVKRKVYNALLTKVGCRCDVLEMTKFNPRLSGLSCSVPTFSRSQVVDILHHYYLNVFKKDVEYLKALKQQEHVDTLKQMYNV